MENFTVTFRNLQNIEETSFFSDFNSVQEFMQSLLGRAFTAEIKRFEPVPMTQLTKMTGVMKVYADTMENVWKKL